jgi:hypothetical protein
MTAQPGDRVTVTDPASYFLGEPGVVVDSADGWVRALLDGGGGQLALPRGQHAPEASPEAAIARMLSLLAVHDAGHDGMRLASCAYCDACEAGREALRAIKDAG